MTIGVLLAISLAASKPARAADGPDPMDLAREHLSSFEWASAYQDFADIAKAAPPKSDRWVQATFGAAVSSSNIQPTAKENADRAVNLYQQILNDAPQSKYAPRAMMNLGRMKELRDYPGDKPDLDGAKELYLKVAATWPSDPIAGEAMLRAAAALVQSYDAPDFVRVHQGISLLEGWLKDHPKDPLANVMWQYLGDSYFNPLNDARKALDCYEHTDAIGWIDPFNQGQAYWRAANLADRVGDTKAAIKYYTKGITVTPNSGKAYESQLALKRLGAPAPEISIFRHATSRPTTQGSTP